MINGGVKIVKEKDRQNIVLEFIPMVTVEAYKKAYKFF
jgi:hypothetical protein